MVPVGGDRQIGVFTDDENWLLRRTGTAGSLRLKDFQGAQVQTGATLDDLVIPRRSFLTFNLHGEAAGDNKLALQDPRFVIGHALRVSVKAKLSKKYAIRLVRDVRRKTARAVSDAKAIMREVEKLYINQANIELTIADEPVEFWCQKI
jgi:hypothetical protein